MVLNPSETPAFRSVQERGVDKANGSSDLNRRRFLRLAAWSTGGLTSTSPMLASPARVDLNSIKALVFDCGGTVFDWHTTISSAVREVAEREEVSLDANAFANRWRRDFFAVMTRVRKGELPFLNADEMHRRSLDPLLDQGQLAILSEADRQALVMTWHKLRAWPDAPSGLRKLRSRFTCSALSVLSFSLLVDASKNAGVEWDAIMSCEFIGHYKPDPEAYQRGAKLLGLAPAQCIMVASHPSDLRGAARAGLYTAYVPRPKEKGPDVEVAIDLGGDFDFVGEDFVDLARELGAV